MAIHRSTINQQDLPPMAQPQLAVTPAQDPGPEKWRFGHRARLALTHAADVRPLRRVKPATAK